MPRANWTELLMTDHETTERVFDAFDRALSGPNPPSTAIVADAMAGRLKERYRADSFPCLENLPQPRRDLLKAGFTTAVVSGSVVVTRTMITMAIAAAM